MASYCEKFEENLVDMDVAEKALRERFEEAKSRGLLGEQGHVSKLIRYLNKRRRDTVKLLESLETYEYLKQRRADSREREAPVRIAVKAWFENEPCEDFQEDFKRTKEELLIKNEFQEYKILDRALSNRLKNPKSKRNVKKMETAMKKANSKFASFSKKCVKAKSGKLGRIRWPDEQTDTFSLPADLAIGQIRFMKRLLNKLETKILSVAIYFNLDDDLQIEERDDSDEEDGDGGNHDDNDGGDDDDDESDGDDGDDGDEDFQNYAEYEDSD